METTETIEVKINGNKETLSSGATVATVLSDKNVRPEMVAVEVNGELVQKGNYEHLVLSDGDQMEFLFYMAGGVR